jgi:septal ring factor EnvC (AmiA/AmiB activator)
MQPTSEESRPNPWMTWVVTVVLAVCTTLATISFTAGVKTEEVRQLQEKTQSHEDRLKALEAYRGDLREALAEIRSDLKKAREDVSEVRSMLLSGKGARYVRGE